MQLDHDDRICGWAGRFGPDDVTHFELPKAGKACMWASAFPYFFSNRLQFSSLFSNNYLCC
jgi:hypothetical protein